LITNDLIGHHPIKSSFNDRILYPAIERVPLFRVQCPRGWQRCVWGLTDTKLSLSDTSVIIIMIIFVFVVDGLSFECKVDCILLTPVLSFNSSVMRQACHLFSSLHPSIDPSQRHYSPGWASASFKSFLHPSRFRATTVQFLHCSFAASSFTPSSQRNQGLPLGRFPPGSLRRTLLDKSLIN